jgi:hypothetical protein
VFRLLFAFTTFCKLNHKSRKLGFTVFTHKIALFGVRTLLVTLYGTSAWLLTRAFRQ